MQSGLESSSFRQESQAIKLRRRLQGGMNATVFYTGRSAFTLTNRNGGSFNKETMAEEEATEMHVDDTNLTLSRGLDEIFQAGDAFAKCEINVSPLFTTNDKRERSAELESW